MLLLQSLYTQRVKFCKPIPYTHLSSLGATYALIPGPDLGITGLVATPMIDPTQFSTSRAKLTSARDELPHRPSRIPRKPGQTCFLTGEQEAPARTTLSVIFPAFNEEGNIRRTVESATRVLPRFAESWEIIVVDDGSQDTTGVICDELAALYPQVHTIHHSRNLGYGAALKSGIIAAKNDLIFFTDSDGQFDLKELRQLIQWSNEYQIVAGYRGKRQDPAYRLLNARGWNFLMRVVLGVKVRDIDCAFKLFHRDVFNRVQIRSLGAMVNTEILAQAMK